MEAHKEKVNYRLHQVVLFLVSLYPVLFCFCTDSSLKKGNLNLNLGDYKRAIYFFSTIVDKNPQSFGARLGLGKALLQQLASDNQSNEVWNACLTNLEAARTLNCNASVENILSVAWHQRAVFHLARHDTTSAMQSLLKSIEYDKSNSKPINLAGILYFNRGDYQKAFNFFTLVMNLDTLSATGYFNAGMVSWSKGDCFTARRLWNNALGKFPEDSELLYWTAMAEKTCANN